MTVAATLVSLLLALTAAHADWEGTITTRFPGQKGTPEIKGKIHVSRTRQRMDLDQPFNLSTILDLEAKKSWNILHTKKGYIEAKLDEKSQHIPACGKDEIAACLTKQGYRKVGREKAQGHDCEVYEADIKSKNGKTHVKLWRPVDLKEVPAVKTIATDSRGGKAESTITEIKQGPLPDSIFELPRNYEKLPSRP